MDNLEILPIKDTFIKRKPLPRAVNPILPDAKSGFVLLMIQKIKQGKTTKIVNFILNPAFYKDVFDNVEQARERAEELGCSGTHTHDEDGNLVYMPCSTHEEYEMRINGDY